MVQLDSDQLKVQLGRSQVAQPRVARCVIYPYSYPLSSQVGEQAIKQFLSFLHSDTCMNNSSSDDSYAATQER